MVEAGAKVSYTDNGVVYTGTVYRLKGEWAYVDLDQPFDTNLGWFTHTMVVRASDLIDI